MSALEPKGSGLHPPPTAHDRDVPQQRPTPSLAAVPRQEPSAVAPPAPRSVVERLPAPGTNRTAAGVGAALSKPGMALVMRTADGEENLTPFRSLDDLLSAVKPILRAAARSPDAVWFSIQPVDLASLDSSISSSGTSARRRSTTMAGRAAGTTGRARRTGCASPSVRRTPSPAT